MGEALFYLLRRTAINRVKNIIKKPSHLILVLFFAVIIGLSFLPNSQLKSMEQLRDSRELESLIFGVFALNFVLMIRQGIESGGAMFRMADVNFLFPAPLTKRSVLNYVMIKSLGTSLFLGLFILFQYTNLHQNYGVSWGGLIIIFLGYGLNAYLAMASFMLIYTYFSDKLTKRKWAMFFCYGLVALVPLYSFSLYSQTKTWLPALVTGFSSRLAKVIPIFGWTSAMVSRLMVADYAMAFFWLAVCLAFLGVVVYLMTASDREYYEDVIASAEKTEEKLNNRRQGKRGEKVRRGKLTGINRGQGALTLFYKHLLEIKRTNKLGLGLNNLGSVVILLGIAYFKGDSFGFSFIFSISIYVMFVTSMNGRLQSELQLPYIYLLPEHSFKKLVFTILAELPTIVLETGLFILGCLFLVDLQWGVALFAGLARVGYAILLLAANVLDRRLFGNLSRGVMIFVHFFTMLLLSIPSAVIGGIIGAIASPALGYGIMVLSTCLTATIILFLCRNLLNNSEINQ